MEKFLNKSNPIVIWLVYFLLYLVFFTIYAKFVQIFLNWTFLGEINYCGRYAVNTAIPANSGKWFCNWSHLRSDAILFSFLGTLSTIGLRSKKPENNYFVIATFTQVIVWVFLFFWGLLSGTLLYWIVPMTIYHDIWDQFESLIYEGIGFNIIISIITWLIIGSESKEWNK